MIKMATGNIIEITRAGIPAAYRSIALCLLCAAYGSGAPAGPAQAQGAGYNWVLTKGPAANGGGSKLEIRIPQSNGVLGRFACVDNQGKGTYSVLTIAANTGQLKSGAPAQVTLTTPQGKYDFNGLAVEPATSGGIKGITFSIANNHPVWPSLAYGPYVDYQVKGNTGSRLNLASSAGKIALFANTCGFAPPGLPNNAAAPAPVKTPQAQIQPPVVAPQTAPTAPAANAPVQPRMAQPQVPTLPLYQTRPGRSAWRTSNYRIKTNDGSERVYTANVTNGGLALHAYCVGGQNLQFFVTRAGRKYPDFAKRLRQAMTRDLNFQFSFPGTGSYKVAMFLDSTGDLTAQQGVEFNSQLIHEFLNAESLSITNPPFGASFQLRSSKKAICKVVKRCGAKTEICGKIPASRSSTKSTRCRPRSVYIAGRGCILRRYAR